VLLSLPARVLLLLLQLNSVVVAGHDTTSFCLTSTVYWVSQQPEVKQRLFAEIDRLGRDKQVTAADMDQLPYLEVRVSCHLWVGPTPGLEQ
jgi:cytochrome P450